MGESGDPEGIGSRGGGWKSRLHQGGMDEGMLDKSGWGGGRR